MGHLWNPCFEALPASFAFFFSLPVQALSANVLACQIINRFPLQQKQHFNSSRYYYIHCLFLIFNSEVFISLTVILFLVENELCVAYMIHYYTWIISRMCCVDKFEAANIEEISQLKFFFCLSLHGIISYFVIEIVQTYKNR